MHKQKIPTRANKSIYQDSSIGGQYTTPRSLYVEQQRKLENEIKKYNSTSKTSKNIVYSIFKFNKNCKILAYSKLQSIAESKE